MSKCTFLFFMVSSNALYLVITLKVITKYGIEEVLQMQH